MTPHEPRMFQRAGVFITNIPFGSFGNNKDEVINNLINSLYSIKDIESGSVAIVPNVNNTIRLIVSSYNPSIKKEIKDNITSVIENYLPKKKKVDPETGEETSIAYYKPEFLFDAELDKDYYGTLGKTGEGTEKGWFMFTSFAGNQMKINAMMNHINKMTTPVTKDGKPNKIYDPFLGIYSAIPLFGNLFIYADRTEEVYKKILSTPFVYFEPHAKTGQFLVPMDTKSDITRYLGDQVNASEIFKSLDSIKNIISGKGGKEITASMLKYLKDNYNKIITYVDVSLIPDFKTDTIVYVKQEIPLGTHKKGMIDSIPDWLSKIKSLKALSSPMNKEAAMDYYFQQGEKLDLGDISFSLKSKVFSEIVRESSSADVLRDPTQVKNRMILDDHIINLGSFSEENGMLDSKKIFDAFTKAQSNLEEMLSRDKELSDLFGMTYIEDESKSKSKKPTTKKPLKNFPDFYFDTKKEGAVSNEQIKNLENELKILESSIKKSLRNKENVSKSLDNYKKSNFSLVDKDILENLNSIIGSEIENEIISPNVQRESKLPEEEKNKIQSFNDYINKALNTRSFDDELSSQIYWKIQDILDNSEFLASKKKEFDDYYESEISRKSGEYAEKQKMYVSLIEKSPAGGEKEELSKEERKDISEKEETKEEKEFSPYYNYEILMSTSKGLYGKAYIYKAPGRKPESRVFNLSGVGVGSPNVDMFISEEGKNKILEEAQRILKAHESSVVPITRPIISFYPEYIKDFESADTKRAVTMNGNIKVVQTSDIDISAMEKRMQEVEKEEKESK